MASNTKPVFTKTPLHDMLVLATANTARDGTLTIESTPVAPAEGLRYDAFEIVAGGTTTAGVVRMFIHDGTNYRLFKEFLVTAITPSTTVEVFRTVFIPDVPLNLPSGYKVGFSTHNAETFYVHAHGATYTA